MGNPDIMLDDYAPLAKQFEPTKKNRFAVTFPESWDIPSWVVKSITRPDMWVADGYVSSGDLTISFYEPLDIPIYEKLARILRNQSENRELTHTISVKMLDPTGSIKTEYIYNSKVVSMESDTFDYSSEQATIIYLNLQLLDTQIHIVK